MSVFLGQTHVALLGLCAIIPTRSSEGTWSSVDCDSCRHNPNIPALNSHRSWEQRPCARSRRSMLAAQQTRNDPYRQRGRRRRPFFRASDLHRPVIGTCTQPPVTSRRLPLPWRHHGSLFHVRGFLVFSPRLNVTSLWRHCGSTVPTCYVK